MSKDQVLKYLELQEQGYRVTAEVAEQLGYKGSEPQRILRQDLRRNGYASSGRDGYYVKKDNSGCNNVGTNSNTSKCTSKGNTKSTDNSGCNNMGTNSKDKKEHKSVEKNDVLDSETVNKLLTLADNFDTIISNTSSNTFGEKIKITPCKSPTAQTIKVDYDVWQKFKKFAKASDYKQQDLLTTALELLMEQMEG